MLLSGKHGYKFSRCLRGKELLDGLRGYQLFEEQPVPGS
jgi:hypothetical protein